MHRGRSPLAITRELIPPGNKVGELGKCGGFSCLNSALNSEMAVTKLGLPEDEREAEKERALTSASQGWARRQRSRCGPAAQPRAAAPACLCPGALGPHRPVKGNASDLSHDSK